ncbi:MAG: DTW domain-containing protein [Sulfurospirillaceae bacterium]|nr:DTW domain-containing protein [Sulfurospirillaceae bacterium]
MQTIFGDRATCYHCYRPKSSCMCEYIRPIETHTKFIILMHPKEFKKTKNGTGHLTHLSLPNSEWFMGIDFSACERINEILKSHQSYILYPCKEAINLSHEPLYPSKPLAIFLIDSTWACALKMMRLSRNLRDLPRISFDATKRSEFKIKEQPLEYCLSTIESTHTVLELLNQWGIETIVHETLKTFLTPFHAMIEYQLQCIENSSSQTIRFKESIKN